MNTPDETTAHIESAQVFAVADGPLVEAVVEASIEDEPTPHDGALFALGGLLLGGQAALGGLLLGGQAALGVLLLLTIAVALCGPPAARARPIEGGTADEAPAGWCACP